MRMFGNVETRSDLSTPPLRRQVFRPLALLITQSLALPGILCHTIGIERELTLMALSDLKTVTLTKQELLVLQELMADYATLSDNYSFRIEHDLVHTEEQMKELFGKLESARMSD